MSILERPLTVDQKNIKSFLINNNPFMYANLIKFERPSKPDSLSGLISTSEQRYTYLTDASRNIDFDDGTSDLQGVANGTQTYLANKVLNVGPIQEQTKATTSATNIVLDGTVIGANTDNIVLRNNTPIKAIISSSGVDRWDIQFDSTIALNDLIQEGFREGDKVSVSYTIGSIYYSIPVNIIAFKTNNILTVSKIDTDLTIVSGISITINLRLASEEVISILLNKNATDYASFINREVFIYRAYFTPVEVTINSTTYYPGDMIGTPIPLFKGIITNVGFEDSESGIKITWGLSSHWGDFSQVRGRITSDSAHRALNEYGVPQPASAAKPIYAYDKGFSHAETSIHMLAKYTYLAEKTITHAKKFLGVVTGVSTKTVYVPEERNTALDFQINSKSIPIIYGVRKTEGIPVFADTKNDDNTSVYMAIVLCEGEIGGIYDIYLEGNSLICNDKADSDVRSIQTPDKTVPLLCVGRADAGQALGGTVSSSTTGAYDFYSTTGEAASISKATNSNPLTNWKSKTYIEPASNSYTSTNTGILDGQSFSFLTPQSVVIDLFSGRTGQESSAQLSKIAYDNNFKIQNNYWTGSDTAEYWGPNHRLLDTAYVVNKFIIGQGETTIPTIEYVVRGKLIDCYNYDYSFLHDTTQTLEVADNFVLGQYVGLYYTNTSGVETSLVSSTQIIDKWTFTNPDGTINTRFRFSINPPLGFDDYGKPSITKFYMKSGSNKWTMTTFNHIIFSGQIAETVGQQIVGVSGSSGNIVFTFANNASMMINGDSVEPSPRFQVVSSSNLSYIPTGNLFPNAIMSGTLAVNGSNTTLTTGYPSSDFSVEINSLLSSYPQAMLVSKNTIKLPTIGSSIITIGSNIEVTRILGTTGKSIVQSANIIAYNTSSRIATIDAIWDFIPMAGDTINIRPKYADSRVSINPAIQTLDYITSKTYGRGLDVYKDIYLPSWTETARKCDTRSDITTLLTTDYTNTSTPIAIGDVYRYPATGNIVWQGTVSNISGKYITFNNVIGKLTNKWKSWKSWNIGDVIYTDQNTFYSAYSEGTIATSPSGTGTINPAAASDGSTCTSLVSIGTSMSLSKVTGSSSAAPTALPLNLTSGNPVQSIKNGLKISGYSLYDCDDISYWRLNGWDEHKQRYVTKSQTNVSIDTSVSLFDNLNGMLEHYNGILRYTSGKYYLDIEEQVNVISGINIITSDDIVGKIQLSDEGAKSSYNSLTTAFADPGNKFEPRNVSFFNSEYLKVDRNVPKKGNLSIPGITNYYNTRLLANKFLTESRYGLSINMTVRQHGILLLAGTVIQIVYPRYGDEWATGKKFRIDSVTYQPDGLTDIVAKEYDDSFYTLSNIKRVAGSGASTSPVNVGIGSPTNLTITSADSLNELLNGVELVWDNDPAANSSKNCYTEVYASLSPNLLITVTSISGSTITTSSAHGLIPGMAIYPQDYTSGINNTTVYYVLTTPTNTTFTMTKMKSGTIPDIFTDGISLSIKVRTATLLATVPTPIRNYIDNITNKGTGRVEKYYWVRHKVLEV